MKFTNLPLHLEHLKQVRTQGSVEFGNPQFLFCQHPPKIVIICSNIILK